MIEEIKDPALTESKRFEEIKELIKQQNEKTKEDLKLKIAHTNMLCYGWYVINKKHWYSPLTTPKSNKIGIDYPDKLFCFDNEFLPLCRQIAKILQKTTKNVVITTGAKVQ